MLLCFGVSEWVYSHRIYLRERHNRNSSHSVKQACETLEKEGERKCGRSSLSRRKTTKEWVHVLWSTLVMGTIHMMTMWSPIFISLSFLRRESREYRQGIFYICERGVGGGWATFMSLCLTTRCEIELSLNTSNKKKRVREL